jgi:hypothetical protein
LKLHHWRQFSTWVLLYINVVYSRRKYNTNQYYWTIVNIYYTFTWKILFLQIQFLQVSSLSSQLLLKNLSSAVSMSIHKCCDARVSHQTSWNAAVIQSMRPFCLLSHLHCPWLGPLNWASPEQRVAARNTRANCRCYSLRTRSRTYISRQYAPQLNTNRVNYNDSSFTFATTAPHTGSMLLIREPPTIYVVYQVRLNLLLCSATLWLKIISGLHLLLHTNEAQRSQTPGLYSIFLSFHATLHDHFKCNHRI